MVGLRPVRQVVSPLIKLFVIKLFVFLFWGNEALFEANLRIDWQNNYINQISFCNPKIPYEV